MNILPQAIFHTLFSAKDEDELHSFVIANPDIFKVEKDELLTLWVADQIIEVTNDEDVALKAMQVAEKEIMSNRQKKGE